MSFKSLSVHIFRQMSISAIWIAFCGMFWIAVLCCLSNMPFDTFAAIELVLITFAVYAWDHASGSREDLLNNPDRVVLAKWHIKEAAIAAYLAAVILFAIYRPLAIHAVLAPGIAGALYTVRIRGIRPKDLPGCKTLIVASSTAICRVGLIDGAAWLYALVFLVMIIDTVLCDMRDVAGDAASGVRTLPVLLGSSRTLMVLAAIDIPIAFLSPVIAAMIGIFILYFRKQRPNLQYDFFIDGWMIWIYMLLYAI